MKNMLSTALKMSEKQDPHLFESFKRIETYNLPPKIIKIETQLEKFRDTKI